MAEPTKSAAPTTAPVPAELPPWDGRANVEQYCAVCQGMVNGNGCGAAVCPVRGT